MDFEAQEMMTRQSAAYYNAHIVSERVKNESTPIIADITAGGGGDTLAIAKSIPNAKVHAFEVSPARAKALQDLVAASRAEVTVHQQDGLTLWEELPECHFIYADPARRHNGKRTLNPEEYAPPLSSVLALIGARRDMRDLSGESGFESAHGESGAALRPTDLMVKLAPGVPREFAHVWVAHKREVVEALYCSWEAPGVRKAVVIDDDGSVRYELAGTEAPATVPSLCEPKAGMLIIEPNGSIIRSGLVANFADQLGLRFIDPHIAYLALDVGLLDAQKRLVERSCSSVYQVQAVMAITPKRIRAYLLEEGFTNVTVKKRGVDIDPHAFRESLKVSKLRSSAAKRGGADPKSIAPKEATIILLRTGSKSSSKRYALVCSPACTRPANGV